MVSAVDASMKIRTLHARLAPKPPSQDAADAEQPEMSKNLSDGANGIDPPACDGSPAGMHRRDAGSPADPPGDAAWPARTLRLERAGNHQVDQIGRLHFAGLVDSGSLSLDPTLDADLVDVEASYADGFFVVASFEDQPGTLVGMGAIRRIGEEWHLKRMRVDAAHRRQGIAQAVLDRLLNEARARGVGVLFLDTSSRQEAAQRLYERNGFVRVGDSDIGGVPSHLYRLTLASRSQ